MVITPTGGLPSGFPLGAKKGGATAGSDFDEQLIQPPRAERNIIQLEIMLKSRAMNRTFEGCFSRPVVVFGFDLGSGRLFRS